MTYRTDPKYVIAYANSRTNLDWLQMGLVDDFAAAKRVAIDYSETTMRNSAVAIFIRRDGDTTYWADKKPCRVYNRHILAGSINSALGGLINSLESDWF